MSQLKDDEVEVWLVDCGAGGLEEDSVSVLSGAERGRAESFRHEADRRRFRVCRSALRRILGRHLRSDPAEIRFHKTHKGKLELPDRTLQFNVSHSGDRGLIAVSRSRRVGVDVEKINPALDYSALLDRVCSEAEKERLRSLPDPIARLEFHLCWARKEALLKAMGVGLAASAAKFDVTDDVRDGRWRIRTLSPDPDYAAAVVAEGVEWTLRRLDFSRFEANP